MEKPKNKVGRPTDYSLNLAQEICDELAQTHKGISQLCKENPNWPDYKTIKEWRNNKEEFCAMYAKAKMQQADFIVEDLCTIAEFRDNDLINNDGKLTANNAAVNRDRLIVDTRKWIACKVLPKVYGDKNQTEIIHKLCDLTVEEQNRIFDTWSLREQLDLAKRLIEHVKEAEKNGMKID